MTIGVVGLGLIGGSMAKAIKANCTYKVVGFDANERVVEGALLDGTIDGVIDDNTIVDCDVLIVALYPDSIIEYVTAVADRLKSGSVVVDAGGVKGRICSTLEQLLQPRGVHFIGGHPMAGIERSGYESSFATLFQGAVMILCPPDGMDGSIVTQVSDLFLAIGFRRIKITDPKEHDIIIAYTSQLAHIVSSAYVKSPVIERRQGFSAGSFKDMTRVARLNADMWTLLFMENREALLQEIDIYIQNVVNYKKALEAGDAKLLHSLLEQGNIIKLRDEERGE